MLGCGCGLSAWSGCAGGRVWDGLGWYWRMSLGVQWSWVQSWVRRVRLIDFAFDSLWALMVRVSTWRVCMIELYLPFWLMKGMLRDSMVRCMCGWVIAVQICCILVCICYFIVKFCCVVVCICSNYMCIWCLFECICVCVMCIWLIIVHMCCITVYKCLISVTM